MHFFKIIKNNIKKFMHHETDFPLESFASMGQADPNTVTVATLITLTIS